jgi:HSP20 family molecular chaperone IbpA
MKFLFPIVASLAAADAWMLVPSFRSPATDLLFKSPTELLREQRALMKQVFPGELTSPGGGEQLSSPRYEITNTKEKFEMAVDLPGVKMEDIDVVLDDNLLTVKGKREVKEENYNFSSQFSQTISLDPTVKLDQFEATLKDGVLVVSAPKDWSALEESKRKIPITMLEATAGDKKEEHVHENIEVKKVETEEKKEEALTP